jgi:RNA polymerase sigma-70 factor (ECF subfamily)
VLELVIGNFVVHPFEVILLPIRDKLFRLALSITGSKEDAEDVVQDVLLHILKKEDLDKIENIEAYCFRSTRNRALDMIALKDNQAETLPDDFDYPVFEDIEREIETQEQIDLVEKWLIRLPEKQQTIFRLREIEELNYKEIAAILNITEEQVKSSLFRLRRKLKEYFDKS